MTYTFAKTSFDSLAGRTIILDIDGTVVASGESEPSQETLRALEILKARNEVVVFSNNLDSARLPTLAQRLGVPFISSRFRKPDPRVLRGFRPKYPLVVIGDKYLTDELFARFLGCEYVRVARLESSNDSFTTKAFYVLDDAARSLANFIKPRR